MNFAQNLNKKIPLVFPSSKRIIALKNRDNKGLNIISFGNLFIFFYLILSIKLFD